MATTTKTFSLVVSPSSGGGKVLLEDFASLRLNGDGTPLWFAYLGENSNQTGTLDTTLGAFKLVTNAPSSGASYVYMDFLPRSGGYSWPNTFMQHFVKSGTFDPNCNRLMWWVKSNHNVTRRPDGGGILEIGTYIKNHSWPDDAWQGAHYYHQLDPNFYANRWHLCTINRVPQHRVGEDPNRNWAEDPEWVSPSNAANQVHYFDGMTIFYFNGVYQSSWTGTLWFDDYYLDKVVGEPDTLVASICACYTGSKYEVTWAGPKNVAQSYDVAYKTTSMKQTGFASGTPGGTVSNPGNAYTGCIWQSPAMTENPGGMYLAIRPQGSSNFTEIYLRQRL